MKRARALVLVHVAVQRRRGVAFALQPLRERLGVALRRDEDDALRDGDVGQQVIEDPVLVRMVVGKMHALLDRERRAAVGLDVDAHGIAHEARGQPGDRAVERRGEQHRLARFRSEQRDALDVVDEAHVEHPVGFVEHEHLERRQVDAAALEMIDEAAGRRDDDVGAARELAVLDRIRRSAVDAHRVDARLRP